MPPLRKAPRTKVWPLPDEAASPQTVTRLLNDCMPLMTVLDSDENESGGVRQINFRNGFTVTEEEQGEITVDATGGDSIQIIGGGGLQPQIATVTVSAADLAAEPGAQKTLIAAPGVGNAIFVQHVTAWFKAGTVAYTGGGNPAVYYEGAQTPGDEIFSCPMDFTAGTKLGYFTQTDNAGRLLSAIENQAITLGTDAVATGNGILYVTIVYSVIELAYNRLVGGDTGDSPIVLVKEIATADLLTSDVTPAEIVEAPGTGKINVLVNVFGLFRAGDTAFVDGADHAAVYGNSPSTAEYISYDAMDLTSLMDQWARFKFDNELIPSVDPKNQPISWMSTNPITTGNGKLYIVAVYYVFDTVGLEVSSGRGCGLRFRNAHMDSHLMKSFVDARVQREAIPSPAASEIIQLHHSAACYTYEGEPFLDEGNFYLLSDTGRDSAATVEQAELTPDITTTDSVLALGRGRQPDSITKSDLQGARLMVGVEDTVPPGDGSGDSVVDFWMWYSVLAAGKTC